MNYSELEDRIGYVFKNKMLAETAMTHSSFAYEHNKESYERLEFLGDSILGYSVAEYLYNYTPQLKEGNMTRMRSILVCENTLFKVAEVLEFSDFLKLSKGEEKTGGRCTVSILADTVEAIIAAIYLDGGLSSAQEFINKHILNHDILENMFSSKDFKSRLQEIVQKNGEAHIEYKMLSEDGPDHNKSFTFCVIVDGEVYGTGSGKTKRQAEQMAAGEALKERFG